MSFVIGRGPYARAVYPVRSNGIGVLERSYGSDAVLGSYELAGVPENEFFVPRANASPEPAVPLQVDVSNVAAGDVIEVQWQVSAIYDGGVVATPNNLYMGAGPVVSTDAGVTYQYLEQAWQGMSMGWSAPGLGWLSDEKSVGGCASWSVPAAAELVSVRLGCYLTQADGTKIKVGLSGDQPTILIVRHLKRASGIAYTLRAPFVPFAAPPFV